MNAQASVPLFFSFDSKNLFLMNLIKLLAKSSLLMFLVVFMSAIYAQEVTNKNLIEKGECYQMGLLRPTQYDTIINIYYVLKSNCSIENIKLSEFQSIQTLKFGSKHTGRILTS